MLSAVMAFGLSPYGKYDMTAYAEDVVPDAMGVVTVDLLADQSFTSVDEAAAAVLAAVQAGTVSGDEVTYSISGDVIATGDSTGDTPDLTAGGAFTKVNLVGTGADNSSLTFDGVYYQRIGAAGAELSVSSIRLADSRDHSTEGDVDSWESCYLESSCMKATFTNVTFAEGYLVTGISVFDDCVFSLEPQYYPELDDGVDYGEGHYALWLAGEADVTVTDSLFENFGQGAIMGSTEKAAVPSCSLTVTGTTFDNCGNTGEHNVVHLAQADSLTFENNTINDSYSADSTVVDVASGAGTANADAINSDFAANTGTNIYGLPFDTVTVSPAYANYDGTAVQPTVTVTAGTDMVASQAYSLVWTDASGAVIDVSTGLVQAGTYTVTATGKGAYSDTVVSETFKVRAVGLIGEDVSAIPDQVYDGGALEPALTVMSGDTVLVADTDYTAEYTNNIDVTDSAAVTITGIGNYQSSTQTTFKITPANLGTATISGVSSTYCIYDKAIEPEVQVFLPGNDQPISSDEYTVTYANNDKPGTGSVTITADSANLTGSQTVEFDISQAVASVTTGGVTDYYDTLQSAVDAAADGGTVVLLGDATGPGVVTADGYDVTIDLGGHAYTVDATVGSTGTETNGFQLLGGSRVTIANGTLTSSTAYILIQNYSDLVLDGVTVDAGSADYAVSDNSGSLALVGGTVVNAREGGIAFDVCATTNYPGGVTVTVADDSVVVNGDIEYGVWGGVPSPNNTLLDVSAGTFNGSVRVDPALAADAADHLVVSGGTWSDTTVAPYVVEGSGLVPDGSGAYTVRSGVVARVGDVSYTTLQSAVDAAAVLGEPATVEVLKDASEDVSFTSGTIVLDLDGHTLNGRVKLDGADLVVSNGIVTGQVDVYGSAVDEAGYGLLSIAEDAAVSSDFAVVLWPAAGSDACFGVAVDVAGALNGILWVHGTIIGQGVNTASVNVSGTITGDDVGIAVNGNADVTIAEGADVTGTSTGIEVRAGSLSVEGGAVTGQGIETTVIPNGNGTTTSGAGIAVAQHTTMLPVSVVVSNGTITGATALYESDPQGNGDAADISISVTGGTFDGGLHSDNHVGFVSGGIFDAVVPEAYCADGFMPAASSDTAYPYTVVEGSILVRDAVTGTGYASVADAIANATDVDGRVSLVLVADATEDVVVHAGDDVVLDLAGCTLTALSGTAIEVSGEFELTDSSEDGSGMVTTSLAGKAAIQCEPGGTVHLLGGTITRTGTDYYAVVNHGDMVIDGATVSMDFTNSSLVENGWYYPDQNVDAVYANLTIEDGSVLDGGLYNVKNDDYGNLVINGGAFANDAAGGNVLNWNKAVINGGDFTSTQSNIKVVRVPGYEFEVSDLVINGGMFTSDQLNIISLDSEGANVTVTGGVFSSRETIEDFDDPSGSLNFPSGQALVPIDGLPGYHQLGHSLQAFDFSASDVVYTGVGQSTIVTSAVKQGDATITEGIDYTVTYSVGDGQTGVLDEAGMPMDAGTYTVNLVGKSSYEGTFGTCTFTVRPVSIASAVIGAIGRYQHTGDEITPTPSVTFGGAALTAGEDFDYVYGSNTDAGIATVAVSGKGNYTGMSSMGYFLIVPANIASAIVTVEPAVSGYTGSPVEPAVTAVFGEHELMRDVDYMVAYLYNTKIGTATALVTGAGNFTGSKLIEFEIAANDLAAAGYAIELIANQTRTGSPIEPAVIVSGADGEALVEGADYTVMYSDNIDVGTATVTITGMGTWAGTLSTTFDIVPVDRQALADAVATALADKDATTVSVDGSDVAPSDQWVDQAAADALSRAIADARGVLDDPNASTSQITEAITAIEDAQQAFDDVKADGVKKIWTRVFGATRYETGTAIVDEAFAAGQTFSRIFLATGDNFPDALAASALCGVYDAPLLLTSTDALTPETRAQIERLAAPGCTVWIIGSEAAVSKTVSDAVAAIDNVADVDRIQGTNRFETQVQIFNEVQDDADRMWGDTCIIATGNNYPDALSIGSWAYSAHASIFGVGDTRVLTDEQISAITTGGFENVLVLGSDNVVDFAGVQEQLEGSSVTRYTRLAGPTRLETSAAVVQWTTGMMDAGNAPGDCAVGFTAEEQGTVLGYDGMAVATASNFPDALSSVNLLGRSGSALMLVDDSTISDTNIADLVEANKAGIFHGWVLGSDTVVTQTTVDKLETAVSGQ